MLARLLHVARLRPLAEFGRRSARQPKEKANGRKTWTLEPLTFETIDGAAEQARERLKENPEFIAQQTSLGRERALIYKMLVLTGLRKGELASLTVAKLDLDGPLPLTNLNPADEKSREGNSIPLRADLADDLRDWLADKLAAVQHEAHCKGEAIPARLAADTPLFNGPASRTATSAGGRSTFTACGIRSGHS